MATLGDLFAGAIVGAAPAPGLTRYEKLKNWEREMEPPPPTPYMPGGPQQWLRGMDTLGLFSKQLLQPKPDPDVLAAPLPRRGLQAI